MATKDKMTGEVLYARVPPGTLARIAAARGRERQSDWLRRVVEEALSAAQTRAPAKKAPGKRSGT